MNDQQWSQIVAKAWTDAAFKKRLLADPAAALKESGVEVPRGLQVKVVENTDQVRHLVLPTKPSGEISEADLEKVAGGRGKAGADQLAFLKQKMTDTLISSF
jgi:hypothetical protein